MQKPKKQSILLSKLVITTLCGNLAIFKVFSTFKNQFDHFFMINDSYLNNVYQWLRHYTCNGLARAARYGGGLFGFPDITTERWLYLRFFRFFVFPANREPDPDAFQPKTFSIPRGIIPQNFRSLGFAVSQTQTH